MASVSPPKPWERAGAGATGRRPAAGAISLGGVAPHTTSTPTATTSTSTSQAPSLPPKPSTLSQPTSALNSVVNRTASNYSPYGAASRLGTSPYAGYGGLNSYSSPYSRFGGMGSSMYGGMGGGYGSMYGGVGGMGGMYGGMGGMGMQAGMDPNDPNSLTHSFSQSTQATFQIIESIVGAFGGFAQMLESTYMATHSSFFAMLLPAPPSKKPFLVFLLAVFGLPYLMGKLIRALARSQEEDSLRRHQEPNSHHQQLLLGPDGRPLPPDQQPQPPDPSKFDFCRVLYDYPPSSSPATPASEGSDLAVSRGDLVAVLAKTDPLGQPSDWWRCRARSGKVGWLPGVFLEPVARRGQITAGRGGGSAGSSRRGRWRRRWGVRVGLGGGGE
ncbi:MAG: peroxisomal membrane (Pex13) [Lasallia pustulata]|uniref:Peroxisomal membrane protein PEX13 n=1 Tax=Lasallia pustulata TaxID=136370 RepID=A0A5M8Q2B7_9LECA|nr:MAG: peroxisomal membrane (Pex13) [Lasallia pustulata]